MDFVKELKQWEPGEVIRMLGAPKRTVYQWYDGTSKPVEWMQPLIVSYLKSEAMREKAD